MSNNSESSYESSYDTQSNLRFDPYWEWLKIPPEQNPPNYYQLLGLPVLENDQAVIEQSVTALVNKLQRLSHGPHVDAAQKLLNEVARARLCLTQPEKKHVYDHRLRQQLSSKSSTSRSPGISHTAVKAESMAETGRANRSAQPPLHSVADQKSRTIKLATATLGLLLLGGLSGHLLVRTILGSRSLVETNSASLPATLESSASANFSQVEQGPERRSSKSNFSTEIAGALPSNSSPTDFATGQGIGNANTKSSETLLQIAESTAAEQRSGDRPGQSESPLDPESFRARKDEVIQVSGTVEQVRASNSGKTNYLHFTQDWNQSLMIFAFASDIPLEQLQPFQSKTIRVRGAIAEEFGSKRVGIKIKSIEQIEILP